MPSVWALRGAHSTSLLMADDPMIRIVILYPATAPDAAKLERLAG